MLRTPLEPGNLHNLRLAFGALDLQFVRSPVKDSVGGFTMVSTYTTLDRKASISIIVLRICLRFKAPDPLQPSETTSVYVDCLNTWPGAIPLRLRNCLALNGGDGDLASRLAEINRPEDELERIQSRRSRGQTEVDQRCDTRRRLARW